MQGKEQDMSRLERPDSAPASLRKLSTHKDGKAGLLALLA